MKMLVKIPMEISHALLERGDRRSRDYETLANGLIQNDQLHIRCDADSAARLIAWAESIVGKEVKKIDATVVN